MSKTCFVIMGYGIKRNINLDATYQEIIKPCIEENNLVPFPLFADERHNAYRCDEISGTASIDYQFVVCLSEADIVIADISTMNVNAIYELGARHALKPWSTILLCAKDGEQRFNFFDLTYVPIVFYDHSGSHLTRTAIEETKRNLNKRLDFAIYSTDSIPDNPIQRALCERKQHGHQYCVPPSSSIFDLYQQGAQLLNDNKFSEAIPPLTQLYQQAPSDENLLLMILARYKAAESKGDRNELVECLRLIATEADVEHSVSESLLGRVAAINLRLYNLTKDEAYYYSALEYYRRGANYSQLDLYCPRNYCALLLRIYEITDDINVLREHYYTAKHYAKQYLQMSVRATVDGSDEDRTYYFYNRHDLKAIVDGTYIDFSNLLNRLKNDKYISSRQRVTIEIGIKKLRNDIEQMNARVKLC